MPGRDDYAILRARLFADERAWRAADLYVEGGIALEETALHAVVGHIGALGLWTSRETDDGVMPGDGRVTFRAAVGCTRRVADVSVTSLFEVGLLRTADSGNGTYLAGFHDCYAPLLQRRERNRKNAAQARKRKRVADVSVTSSRRNGDVSDHRTEGPLKGNLRDGTSADADAPVPSPFKKCKTNFFRYCDSETREVTWGPPPPGWTPAPGLRPSMSGKNLKAPGAP